MINKPFQRTDLFHSLYFIMISLEQLLFIIDVYIYIYTFSYSHFYLYFVVFYLVTYMHEDGCIAKTYQVSEVKKNFMNQGTLK